jgi:hypothetical protein
LEIKVGAKYKHKSRVDEVIVLAHTLTHVYVKYVDMDYRVNITHNAFIRSYVKI